MGLFGRIRQKFKAKPPQRQVTTPTRQASSTPAQAQSRSSSDDVLNPFNPVSPLNLMSHDDYAPTTRQTRSDSDSSSSSSSYD